MQSSYRTTLAAGTLALAFLGACSVPDRPVQEPRHHAVLHPAVLRPVVMGRAAWHADQAAVRPGLVYDRSVKAVFVHHTDNPNDYDCKKDVPAMLVALEQQHIALGWDDLGYNFVVDRCGGIYEGRTGSVDRDVRGAHTEGFNTDTLGIAALGNFGPGQRVPQAMLRSIAEIVAWKLAPSESPLGKVRLTSSNNGSRFPKGTRVSLDAVSGHRDVYETDCPGQALYNALPWIRKTAQALRAKATWAG